METQLVCSKDKELLLAFKQKAHTDNDIVLKVKGALNTATSKVNMQ